MRIAKNKVFESVYKYRNIISPLLILLFALLLLRSAFYSIATPDESFYLTIPYRLIKGDRLIIDEWHASQLSAVLLCLPMKIFMLITKSTDGILLYFRCLFVFCQTAIALFTFHKLKKYGTFCALVSSVLYLLYVPETVNMLDYYTMSLMGFQVVSLILFCSESISKFQLWFTGVVFACVVLAQPFNCLIYFIYSFAVLFYLVKNKNKAFEQKNYLSPKIWLYITLGILSVAIVFCVFLFSQMSISELIHYLPNLFGGQDHTLPFAETGSTDMFSYYVIVKTLFSYFPLSFVLSILLMAGICLDKNRCNNREIWLYVSSFVAAVMLAEYVFKIFTAITVYLFNPYLLFVLTFVSLMLAEKKNTKLFMIFCTGIVYTVFLGIISQALDYIGVIGLVLSNIALAPACKGLYCELYLNRPKRKYRDINGFLKKTTSAVVVCSIATVVLSGIAIKCFDDPGAIAFGRSSKSADTVLSEGPLKGIAVNSDIEEEYNHILEDLYSIKNEKCEKVLVAALIPWTYFCFDEAPCTFTTWFIPGELDLYSSYYENAEKIPQCIYVPRTSFYWGDDYLNTALRYREFFSEMFDVEIKNGKSGYIMYRNTGVS